jgi:hypothetical protein
MEVCDILECKQMLRKPGSESSVSDLSENFILQISAKATYMWMLCRSDSVDDKDFASSLHQPSISQDKIVVRSEPLVAAPHASLRDGQTRNAEGTETKGEAVSCLRTQISYHKVVNVRLSKRPCTLYNASMHFQVNMLAWPGSRHLSNKLNSIP